MVHNPGSRRQLLTFLAAASFSCFGPMSIARDIADVTFTPQSTVGDVLDEPLFEPFARYLLPLETVSRFRDLSEADRKMPLSRLSRLLPYHTYVDVSQACGILNRLKARAKLGDRIWIPLSHKDAGLFFFPGPKGAPFVLICAGGGFVYVGSIHEGFPYAEAMNRNGLNAFVLQYRVSGGGRTAMTDMAEGLHYIITHAKELGVSETKYALMGSSAGARMAAVMGDVGLEAYGFSDKSKASAVLMAYTGYSDVSYNDPPTFMVQGTNDYIAPVRVVDWRMRAMKELGIEVEYMRVEGMPHGFGLGTKTAAEGWVDRAAAFFKRQLERSSGKG